jgi:AraC family transcriptional regulator
LGLTVGSKITADACPGFPMNTNSAFSVENTHGVLQRFNANFGATSEGLGWSQAFASLQREHPFEGRFEALSDCLMVLHRGGPVDVTFRMEGKTIARHIPKGGIFFLPADHECDVSLHSELDTLHIYLRADLFKARGDGRCRATRLEPVFGQPDPVLEHLGEAIGEVIRDHLGESSLFVDPLVNAIAKRFIALNFRDPPPAQRRPSQLTNRQIRNLRDFVELELHRDIKLDEMAGVCGLSTEYFMRLFKATLGISPYQHVIGRRVERAKALLQEDGESLAEIAVACGFSHQEHMSRMFRRWTGVTPGQYRRERD